LLIEFSPEAEIDWEKMENLFHFFEEYEENKFLNINKSSLLSICSNLVRFLHFCTYEGVIGMGGKGTFKP
jgi:hypothetical protein